MAGVAGIAPRAVFLSLSSGPRCAAPWPVWIRSTVMSVLPGGSVLLCATTGALGLDVQKTVGFPQLQFITVVDISFVVQRLFPMVLVAIEIPVARG